MSVDVGFIPAGQYSVDWLFSDLGGPPRIVASAQINVAPTQSSVDVWTPIGPDNAQLLNVVTDPSASNRLYATGTIDFYRSTDSGTTWTRVTPVQVLSTPGCSPITSPPAVQSDGVIWATICNALYKSMDAGTSWISQGLIDLAPVADPTDPMVLYALTFDGTLHKSTDGGLNWSRLDSDIAGNSLTQLVVDATLPSRLYALSPNSVYKSQDAGVSWMPVNTGLPTATFNSLALSGSTLFVGIDRFGVYKTVDNGTTWTPANNGISTKSIKFVRAGSGSTLYAMTESADYSGAFFRSTDGGASWFPAGTLNTLVNDFTVSRQGDSILYAATLRGLAKSSNAGASWTFDPHNGMKNAAVSRLYLDALNPSVLYARSEFGDYGTVDGGASWSPLALADGTRMSPIGVSPTRSGTVYGTNPLDPVRADIYRSANFGIDWTAILGIYHGTLTLFEAPNASGSLFVIGSGYSDIGGDFPYVIRSDDGGASWSNASSGLPQSGSASIAAMAPGNPNALYVIVSASNGAFQGMYKTSDGGGSWIKASEALPEATVHALAVSPANSSTMFAGLGPYSSGPVLFGLYRSDDGGATWGPRNPAFVNLAVTALAIDPNSPSNVYAATGGGGLYRSTDGGTSFRPINNGLAFFDSLSVNAIAVDPVDGRNLYIGTDGGAFALTLDRYDSFVPVIEYYNYALDHYFIASETQADIPALDSGAFAGWVRTGQAFKAYPQAPQAASRVAFKASPQAAGVAQPVCRFYIPPQHGDSHFYSANVSECAAVLAASTDPANPAYPFYSGYVYETAASFYVDVPADGSCPPAELPVYRLWNHRFDSNHRYTTDPAIRDAMIANGYVLEGVVMCALP